MAQNALFSRPTADIQPLALRPFNVEDITVPSYAWRTSLVSVPPEGSKIKLQNFLRKHSNEVLETLRQQGAVIFRHYEVNGATEFEESLRAMGLELDQYVGGVGPRSKIAGSVFTSTDAPEPAIINYHTEMAYQTQRPGILAFYCDVPPQGFGETPIFDCAKVFASLPLSLQKKLLKKGVRYRKYFDNEAPKMKITKTWREAFGTNDRAAVESMLKNQGVEFIWQEDGSLITEIRMPAVLEDPITNQKCLNLVLLDKHSVRYNVRRFAERYGDKAEEFEKRFGVLADGANTVSVKTFFGDGKPFSLRESEAIQAAAWKHAIIFKWQQGDVVILNNLRYAHARLNYVKPRSILVALAAPFDITTLKDLQKAA